ncbi:MAG TPA: lipopolysaccharide heptosyltransferase I [Thermoanaerobaculia bacterium]|nr:lipopolysaccharide heptosyltransferase I [Thermoanaerobaculia bacterium]
MNRLLVLRLSALGDVIHTIPAVVALRDALPETKIVWAVEAPYRELVEVVTNIETIPVRLKRWSRAPISFRKEIAIARNALRGFDTSIDFQGLMKSAALGWLSGAKTRYGFDRNAVREKPALLFTNKKIAVDINKHVIDQNNELAQSIAGNWQLATGNWSAFPREVKGYEGSVVLLPGAGRPEKLWPVERFRELARRLGDHALVVWGPGEEEHARAIGARIAPPTDLRELAYILAHASLVIGGDTGPLHLAAALGTRVVGLYGPTNPRRNGPYGQLSRCIDKFPSTKLMESISVEEAMTMAEKVLAE